MRGGGKGGAGEFSRVGHFFVTFTDKNAEPCGEMRLDDFEYVSVGSAGLGLFAYFGLIKAAACTMPAALSATRGYIGVSAGAFACLAMALRLHESPVVFDRLVAFAKQCSIISNHKTVSFGIFAKQIGKNLFCDLHELASFTLRLGGIREDATLRELQARVNAQLVFVATDLTTQEPLLMHADAFPDLPVREAVAMSAAVPFLTAPVLFRGHLVTDGAVAEHINASYFDPERTLFIMSEMISEPPRPSEEPSAAPDLISATNQTMLCYSRQLERVTRTCLYDFRCVRVCCKSMFKYMDSPSYRLEEDIDVMYAQGFSRLLAEQIPDALAALGRMAWKLARNMS